MSPRPLRRAQAIVPFGVGAMIDFPGPVSLVHCGLDAWPFSENDPEHREFRIEDEARLADRLDVKYFVQPPDFRRAPYGQASSQPNLFLHLPFLRFPKWHVCPRCGRMHLAALHDRTAPVCEGPLSTGRDAGKPHSRRSTVQVRFVAACVAGHLQDFPWWEWVFNTANPGTSGRRLRLNTSGSASLAGVRIICEEDTSEIKVVKRRTLSGAFGHDPGSQSPLTALGIRCCGENPALGIPSTTTAAPGCGEELHPLLRGGSNVYFPKVVSAIYLPPVDMLAAEDVLEILEDRTVWQFIKMMAQAVAGVVTESIAESVLNNYYQDRSVTPAELAEAANRRLQGNDDQPGARDVPTDSEEQSFRRQEYELLVRDVEEGYPKTNLLTKTEDINNYGPAISRFFSRVTLVHKLRETRAFVGFSRIYPDSSLPEAEKRRLISRAEKEWLPAVIVRGEGLFLVLQEELLRSWLEEHQEHLLDRMGNMQSTLDRLRAKRKQEDRELTPRFVLLHTLAHVLINQLIYDSGYGSASLRERIYCSDDEVHPMAGILLYTAAGDSEGTMGGLVRMGRPERLEGVVLRALEKSRWCSTDPVCIESHGQGPDSCNLAACHSCALLPETCCEEQNRLLDRGLLIGTLPEQDLGFFNI
jgi:hypothetical protein